MPTDVFADLSGSITTGGTAQSISIADPTRKSFWIQNTSDTVMRVKLGGTASATSGFKVNPDSLLCITDDDVGNAITQNISIFCATTGKTFEAGRS